MDIISFFGGNELHIIFLRAENIAKIISYVLEYLKFRVIPETLGKPKTSGNTRHYGLPATNQVVSGSVKILGSRLGSGTCWALMVKLARKGQPHSDRVARRTTKMVMMMMLVMVKRSKLARKGRPRSDRVVATCVGGSSLACHFSLARSP